jgi:glycosyltransferase involved in cell wall biosynthesis
VPIVLFAGLIEPYKGLGDLIDAFGSIARRVPTALLVVAGRANLPVGPFDEQIERAGLRNRCRVDLGFHPQSRFAAYLQAADVVALPYREVTSSGVLMAARRYASPIVASNVGDFAELIADHETGLLVPPRDSAALGAAIERLLTDERVARKLGEAGRQRARSEASWERSAGVTIELYRRILAL